MELGRMLEEDGGGLEIGAREKERGGGWRLEIGAWEEDRGGGGGLELSLIHI